jgi:hypothetical protein
MKKMNHNYYEEKTYTDGEGREIIHFVFKGAFDLEDDVDNSQLPTIDYEYAAIVGVPVPMGQMGPIPLIAIERARLPIRGAKTIEQAFQMHDETVAAAKAKLKSEMSKPNIVTAANMPPAPQPKSGLVIP